MRFAYRDVGEGREQDAEASYLSTSYGYIYNHIAGLNYPAQVEYAGFPRHADDHPSDRYNHANWPG